MNFSVYLVLFLISFPSQSESQSGIFEDLVKFLDELLDWKDPEKVSKEEFRGRNIVQELKTRQTSDVCLLFLLSWLRSACVLWLFGVFCLLCLLCLCSVRCLC